MSVRSFRVEVNIPSLDDEVGLESKNLCPSGRGFFIVSAMSDVISFGAQGDGRTDDTEAIRHAVEQGDGVVRFFRGTYLVSETIEITLDQANRTSIEGGDGTAKIVMTGPGPAFRLVGNHGGTADPLGVQPAVWQRQRFPVISNLEIEGRHELADGIELAGTFQPVISQVLLRDLRHGLILTKRNRNVLISNCQIYHNRGVGILLESVNLHQINITGNHISYNRLGGIRIQGSEIRNLQITGNDIEYNNYRSHAGADPGEATAEILIDTRTAMVEGISPSVRELTISSNTIQSTYSPNGANIRILGPDPSGDLPPGMAAISGNVIGNQAINVHLVTCRGISLSGNFIYSGFRHNVLVERSDDLSFGTNTFGHNYWVPTREIDANLRFVESTDCVLNGLQLRGAPSGKTNWEEQWNDGQGRNHRALIEFEQCRRFVVSGCHLRDPGARGMSLDRCSGFNLTGCQVVDTREAKLMVMPIEWTGEGEANLVNANILGHGSSGGGKFAPAAKVRIVNNLETDLG